LTTVDWIDNCVEANRPATNQVVCSAKESPMSFVKAKNVIITLIAVFLCCSIQGCNSRNTSGGFFNQSLVTLMTSLAGGSPALQVQIESRFVVVTLGELTEYSGRQAPAKIPDQPGTEISGFSSATRLFTANDLTLLDQTLPPGIGPDGGNFFDSLTTPQPGQYMITVMTTNGNVPLEDDSRFYDYSFVLDRDNNSANNFTPVMSFPNDFFKETDLWVRLSKSPGNPWDLTVTDARNNNFQTVNTDARCYVKDNVVTFMVPMDAIGMVANPCFRVTTFCHGGDFGQAPPHDWSGDDAPKRGTALAKITDENRVAGTVRVEIEIRVLAVEDNFLSSLGINLGDTTAFSDSPPNGRLADIGQTSRTALPSVFAGGPANTHSIFPPNVTNEIVGSLFLENGALPLEPFGVFSGAPLADPQGFLIENSHSVSVGNVTGDPVVLPISSTPELPFDILSSTLTPSQVAMIINAVDASSSNVVLSAPRITALDNQRSIINTRAEKVFISDLDFDFDLAIFSDDPNVSTATSGPTLDLVPTINADTGTVSVEFRPSSKLVQYVTSDGITIGNVNGNTLVPVLREGRSVGQLQMQDGETVILGGLANSGGGNQVEGIPFLGDLPIVGHFFQNEALIQPNQNLMILVTPFIVRSADE
jgi:Flp pilus assembly secretin CpaC